MVCIYIVLLAILFFILKLLWKEEKTLKNNITQGRANKFWILRERRKFVRFDEEVKIRYNLRDKSPNFHNSKTSNISRQGLCLLTYEKLKQHKYLELELELPGFSKAVKLTGEVRWTKDLKTRDSEGRRLFYVGIEFSKINHESEAMLLTHLNRINQRG